MAWGIASRQADVQDVYVERVNPDNPHQVSDRGTWVDTTIVADPIHFRGGKKPFAFEREYTSHGVIVASDQARHLAYAVRWTGFEPGTAVELAALGIDRAR
jgi:penicillin amidase